MTAPQLFFGYFAIVMTVLSIVVVTRRDPVHSILWLLVLFIHIAGLYLFLNAEFLAVIQIIVYAGAILVLYLFVVMLLNLKKEETVRKYQDQWPIAVGVGVILAVFFVSIVGKISVLAPLGKYSIEAIKSEGSLMSIGKVLYTEYLLPFEIASILLLVAIIGAVILAKKRIE